MPWASPMVWLVPPLATIASIWVLRLVNMVLMPEAEVGFGLVMGVMAATGQESSFSAGNRVVELPTAALVLVSSLPALVPGAADEPRSMTQPRQVLVGLVTQAWV